jgi:hypothetical protein
LLKFNGKKITLENAQEVIGGFIVNAKEGDELEVVVGRKKSETSKSKKIKLKSNLFAVSPPQKNNLVPFSNATVEQLQLRTSWIGKH